MGSVPCLGALYQVGGEADQSTHHDHGMQTDEPPAEEGAQTHLGPAVVVGIADDEP